MEAKTLVLRAMELAGGERTRENSVALSDTLGELAAIIYRTGECPAIDAEIMAEAMKLLASTSLAFMSQADFLVQIDMAYLWAKKSSLARIALQCQRNVLGSVLRQK